MDIPTVIGVEIIGAMLWFAVGWLAHRRHYQTVAPWKPKNGKMFTRFYAQVLTEQATGPTRVKHIHRINDLPRGARVHTEVWVLRGDDVLPVGPNCLVEIVAYEPGYEEGTLLAGWTDASQSVGMLTHSTDLTAQTGSTSLHIENFDGTDNQEE